MSTEVSLANIKLDNPVLVASGAFGYAKEAARIIDVTKLGGIVPKTVTVLPRPGNVTPRTAEVTAGLLNSIGLDNDGIDDFCEKKMPFLRSLERPIFVSIAAKQLEDCQILAEKLNDLPGVTAVELNVSCPNVSGGVDYGANPKLCEQMTSALRRYLRLPFSVKLSPNVTDVAEIAKAAEAGGADMISAVNTCFGLAIDWRKRKPLLGKGCGGFSGPAIKPIALRCVWQVAQAVKIPIIGIGGIASVDDVMDYLVAGATAVQIGTANFYKPNVTTSIIEQLPIEMEKAGVTNLADVIGALQM
ncbi:MAG: dihydroorotate dehydrogenase [Planctomycetia bacterium]|nr:dihydroorotate dehydrogenase [Planctomycetia bacterium]